MRIKPAQQKNEFLILKGHFFFLENFQYLATTLIRPLL